MTYVITFPCIGVKDASCVDVCPVDCIHPTPYEPGFAEAEQLYINPDECIDCGACETACPVSAIFEENAVPNAWKSFLQKNADFFEGKPKQPKTARRVMHCMCGQGKGSRHPQNKKISAVTTQLVLLERKKPTNTSGRFVPYAPTRLVLVERQERRKDA